MADASLVAPHVGAWIEIYRRFVTEPDIIPSHPMWVRGLKCPKK